MVFGVNDKWKLRDELRRKHLIKPNGKAPVLIVLKCKNCQLKRPPAALFYCKLLLEKGKLKCERCGGKAFVRTDRELQQSDLYQKAIAQTKHMGKLTQDIDDEIEGKMEDDLKVKQKDFMKVFKEKARVG